MKNILKTFPLVFVLLLAPLVRVANAQQPASTPQAERIKTDVDKRLANKKERVTVKLQNGAEVKGRIAQAGSNTFTVSDAKSGRQTEIAYADVAKLKGRGLSKWAKVGIVTGIGIGVVVIIFAIAFHDLNVFGDDNRPILR
jgi:small nuclear ribonucleoprotein (snRNP)-like protein